MSATIKNPRDLYPFGSKQRGYSLTAEIAAKIRADIRQAIKDGHLPCICRVSVRKVRCSRLDVDILALPFNPYNPERVALDTRRGGGDWLHTPIFTPAGRRVLDILEAIVDQYRYDHSDSMTDYFDSNFWRFVGIDRDAKRAWQDEILAALEMGA